MMLRIHNKEAGDSNLSWEQRQSEQADEVTSSEIAISSKYREMLWFQAPLSSLTSAKVKWTWTEECQTSFDNMKKLIAKETLLTYPNFNKTFEIHTDASKVQLGACISQEGKPVAFYSRKLNPAQTRYTTTERELLSIVETLK